jgi:peroxiredoxin
MTGQQDPPRTPSVVAAIGEPAPAFALPDLDGELLHHTDLRGQFTLILFWRPDCPFCQRMLDDLKAWDRTRVAGQPRLLMVSSGTVEVNRSYGLSSPIVLDQRSHVARLFGAKGTPMAVLVDPDGKIGSPVTAGRMAILALANQIAG